MRPESGRCTIVWEPLNATQAAKQLGRSREVASCNGESSLKGSSQKERMVVCRHKMLTRLQL